MTTFWFAASVATGQFECMLWFVFKCLCFSYRAVWQSLMRLPMPWFWLTGQLKDNIWFCCSQWTERIALDLCIYLFFLLLFSSALSIVDFFKFEPKGQSQISVQTQMDSARNVVCKKLIVQRQYWNQWVEKIWPYNLILFSASTAQFFKFSKYRSFPSLQNRAIHHTGLIHAPWLNIITSSFQLEREHWHLK